MLFGERIASNRNFFPHFKDCIGAVDGTHILVQPTLADKALWCDRKGFYSQNVLVICDFDMAFTNALFGWEVLQEAGILPAEERTADTEADDEECVYNITQRERNRSSAKRNAIAEQMWARYSARRESREIVE